MRVFAASSIKRFEGLGELFADLEQNKFSRPVKTKELHLTFRFFGEITGRRLETLLIEFSKIQGKKFRITLDGIGAFPILDRANVLFMRIVPNDEIYHNWEMINAIEREKAPSKEFVPHITISRFKKPCRCAQLAEKYSNLKFTTEIDRISLYNSTLTAEGPVYSVMESIQLK